MKYAVKFIETTYLESEGESPDVEWGQQDSYNGSVQIYSLHRGDGAGAPRGYDVDLLDEYDQLYGYDDVAVGDVVYAVIVEYTDGDTFGYSFYWTIPAIKSDPAEAEKIRARCERPNDTVGYRPWDGYFAGLNDARVERFIVQ